MRALWHLQWARIFDRNYSELLPRLLHVVVGLSCFAVQLWSEISTWVNRVVLRARELKVEEGRYVLACVEGRVGKDVGLAKKGAKHVFPVKLRRLQKT